MDFGSVRNRCAALYRQSGGRLLKTKVELTAMARRKAEAAGLLARLERLSLGEGAAKGDFVELAGDGENATFIIRARRFVVSGDGSALLILELDHPPRPASR